MSWIEIVISKLLLTSLKLQTMFIKTTFKDSKKVKRIRNNRPEWGRHESHLGYITHLKHDIICFLIGSWLMTFYTIGNNDNNTVCHRWSSSYKNRCVGLLVLHLLSLLNHDSSSKCNQLKFFYRYYFGRCSSELA